MIYYIIGIRRSGLHAIANWLFPMMGEYIYLNNYELGKLQKNEFVVNGNFNVIIGLENKLVKEVLKYTNNGKRIWIHRNIKDVMKSQEKHYQETGLSTQKIKEKLVEAISLDIEYQSFWMRSDGMHVFYEKWNNELDYRQKIASALDLQFNDSNKEKIFGYGKSSYDKTTI